MGTLLLLQVALDLGLIAFMTVLLIERSKAKNGQDPRLSRGLQLLTSKIAIIEDLMDRTETMCKQVTQLIEGKQQDVQESIEKVERHLHRLHESMEKSKRIAKLFQDKIPHEEIIERQNSEKYLKAAKLAHAGQTVEEILRQIDIPRGELELIVKLNKHKLVATESENTWIETSTHKVEETKSEPVIVEAEEPEIANIAPTVTNPITSTMIYSSHTLSGMKMQEASIRPVVFKKIEVDSKRFTE